MKYLGTKVRHIGVTMSIISLFAILLSPAFLMFNIWPILVTSVVVGWLGLVIGLLGLIMQNME